MDQLNDFTSEDLFKLCESPIECISQAMWDSDWIAEEEFSLPTSKISANIGDAPALVFQFDNSTQATLLAAASDTRLFLQKTGEQYFDDLVKFIKDVEYVEEGETYKLKESYRPIGVFDLDSVICPIPESYHHKISKALVVTNRKDSTLLGFCLWINLGVRIGCFVAPYSGITLSFNETCDEIIQQALVAQEHGLVDIIVREYPDVNSKKIKDVDWFDWLYKK